MQYIVIYTMIFYRDLSNKKTSYVYMYVIRISFLCVDLLFHLYHFSSAWWTSFNISCRESVGDEFLQLLYVWKYFYFAFVLGDIFAA